MIHYFVEDISFKLKNKRLITKWLKRIASESGRTVGELNYIFCSDSYLLDINKRFLGHDYYTDIITFDSSEDYLTAFGKKNISGDIFISIDTVRANAEEYGEGIERELHRVIVHGLLHLIGYDDTSKKLSQQMRRQENLALDLYFRLKDDSSL